MQVSSCGGVLFTVPVAIRQTLVWSLISKLIGGTPAGTAASSLGIEVRDRQHQAVLNFWQVWVPQPTQVPTPIKWSENCILVWLDMKMEFVIMKYRLHSCHFLKRCRQFASVDKVNICRDRREGAFERERKKRVIYVINERLHRLALPLVLSWEGIDLGLSKCQYGVGLLTPLTWQYCHLEAIGYTTETHRLCETAALFLTYFSPRNGQ